MTEKIERWNAEDTLGDVDEYSVVTQTFQDKLEVMQVLLMASASNEKVVNVYITEMQTLQDLVHESLKGLGSIPETKWHSQKLEKTKWCGHSSFGNVLLCHRYLVIRPHQVDVGEDCCAVQSCSEVL